MMACRRRVSVSFWATGWSCTIPIRPTWATGGRIPRSTTILRSFTRRHYGWGSTCSLTPWARRGDRHSPSAAAARRAARTRPRRSSAAHERGRRVRDRGSGAGARAARRGCGGGVAPHRRDSGRRGVARAPGGTPRRGHRRGAAGRDDRRYSRGERGGRARAGGERRSERGALGAGRLSSGGGGRARGGGSVTVTLEVPAATRAILWTRGPGEPWRAAPIALDSLGRATRRLGPLGSDLYLRASSGSRRSVERRVSVALPAFLAGLELTARYPEYLARPGARHNATALAQATARDRRTGRSRSDSSPGGELAGESDGEAGGGRARVAGCVGRG